MNNSFLSFFVAQKHTALKANLPSAVSSKSVSLLFPKNSNKSKSMTLKGNVSNDYIHAGEEEEEPKEKAPINSHIFFTSDAELLFAYKSIEICILSSKVAASVLQSKTKKLSAVCFKTFTTFSLFPFALAFFTQKSRESFNSHKSKTKLDTFSVCFASQLGYMLEVQTLFLLVATQFPSKLVQPAISFFYRYSPFFSSNLVYAGQCFDIASKQVRYVYAFAVASFFQTGIFFDGNSAAISFFHSFFVKNLRHARVAKASKKGNAVPKILRERSTRLYSSKYARRMGRENSRFISGTFSTGAFTSKEKSGYAVNLPVHEQHSKLYLLKAFSTLRRRYKAKKAFLLPFFSRCSFIHTKRSITKNYMYNQCVKRFKSRNVLKLGVKRPLVSSELRFRANSVTSNRVIPRFLASNPAKVNKPERLLPSSTQVEEVRAYLARRSFSNFSGVQSAIKTTKKTRQRGFLRQSAKFRSRVKLSREHRTKSKRRRVKKMDPSLLTKKKVSASQLRTLYFKLYPSTSQEAYLNSNTFTQLKYLLSVRANSRFSFYPINALSLVRFAYDHERHVEKAKYLELRQQNESAIQALSAKKKPYENVKLSQRFLAKLEREMASRFRYVAIYIKDLIRITFFSVYLKKVSFLAAFYAFTLSKLPRNRKETKFLRFLRKLLKVFASQRMERVGVRIRFQGRVNR